MNKTVKITLILLIILGLISSLGYVYRYNLMGLENKLVTNNFIKWQNYEDKDLGVNFNYPNGWEVALDNSSISIVEKNNVDENDMNVTPAIKGKIIFTKYQVNDANLKIDSNWTLDQFIEYLNSGGTSVGDEFEPIRITKSGEIIIAGEKAYLVTIGIDISESYGVILKHNSTFYTISLVARGGELEENKKVYLPVFEKFVNSFKFISNVIETADWKTYTNEKYKISFKYPLKYSYFENNTYEPVGSRRLLVTLNDKDNFKSKEIQIHISDSGFSSPDGLGALDVSDYSVCGVTGEKMIGSLEGSHSYLYRISRVSNPENKEKYSYSFYLGEEAYQSNENRTMLKSIVDNCTITK